jgi:hypothetical protein
VLAIKLKSSIGTGKMKTRVFPTRLRVPPSHS